MKNYVLLFLLAAFLCSCAATKGVYDKKLMEQKDPYVFLFKGSKSKLRTVMKRLFVRDGFEIAEDDYDAGLIVTRAKILADDESFDTTWSEVLFSARVKAQQGTITIIYSEINPRLTQYELICRLSVDVEVAQNAFKDDEYRSDRKICPQGHPFPMKWKTLFLKYPDYFSLSTTKPQTFSVK